MSSKEPQHFVAGISDLQSDISTLAWGALISLSGKIGGRALQLLVQIILARLLGPAMYGLYMMGYTTYQITGQIGLMGVNDGVVQLGGRALKREDGSFERILRHGLWLGLICGLFFGGAIYWLAPWVASQGFQQPGLVIVLQGFAFTVFFTIGLRVTSAITRISKHMVYTFWAEDVLPMAVNLVLVIILVVLFRWSIWGAMTAILTSYAVGLLLSIFFIHRLFPTFVFWGEVSLKEVHNLLGFSFFAFLSSFFYLLLYISTTLLVGFFLAPLDAGHYQAAANISMLAPLILTGFSSIFAPMIPALHQADNRLRLNELYAMTTRWGLYLYLPIFLVLVLMPEQVIGIVFGEAYLPATLPLVILSFANLINVATGAVNSLYIMTKHEKSWAGLTGVAFLLSLILSGWFIPTWGIMGAALSMGIGLVFLNLAAVIQLRFLLQLWPYNRQYFQGGWAALVTTGLIFVFRWFVPTSGLLGLVVVFLLAFASFGIVLILLGIGEDDKTFLQTILSKGMGTSKI